MDVLWYRLAVKKVGSMTSRIFDSELNLVGAIVTASSSELSHRLEVQ